MATMRSTLFGASTLLVLAACGDSQTSTSMTEITLSAEGLEALSSGAYEGWLVFGDEKVSTGVFTDPAQAMMVTDRNPAEADLFVLTIEPAPDDDPTPSGIILLAGDISADGTTANLAFGTDLSSATGGFILKTPSDDSTSADNDSAGVWFLDVSSGSPMAALTLPTLPSGFVYEGWAVTQGQPISTGRFSTASGADSGNPYSGNDGTPPFPGEDFVANLPSGISAVNLADGSSTIVISVEPDSNGVDPTGPAPFAIKPLAKPVPAQQAAASLVSLGTGPVGNIFGSASFAPVDP